MKIRVCSGWHPAGSAQYGQRFLASFDKYWPKSIELQVYVEEPEDMPRDACLSLFDIPDARDLDAFMKSSEAFAGRTPLPGWKKKCIVEGYNFRFDARKFWKQILIPGAAGADLDDGDILIWLDGDVNTIKRVPLSFIPDLLGDGDVAFLGREPKHSEIGFWAVRINIKTRSFLADIAETYKSHRFAELKEWHSAYVWDDCRRRAGLKEVNLCAPGARGHVWPATRLQEFTRHDKGARKPGGIA